MSDISYIEKVNQVTCVSQRIKYRKTSNVETHCLFRRLQLVHDLSGTKQHTNNDTSSQTAVEKSLQELHKRLIRKYSCKPIIAKHKG